MDVARKLIHEKIQEHGLDMKKVSLAIGNNHAYLQQFLKKNKPRELPERVREKLAPILRVNPDQLRGPSEPLPKRDYVKTKIVPIQNNIAKGERRPLLSPGDDISARGMLPWSGLVGPTPDFPVFGTAEGGDGALIVTNSAVEWVFTPIPLAGVVDAYGMIVSGDSMAPGIKSGAVMLVNPHMKPRSEDICIFRKVADDGTEHARVKEFISQTDQIWRVRQYNPRKDISLKKSEWQICHVTIGQYFRR